MKKYIFNLSIAKHMNGNIMMFYFSNIVKMNEIVNIFKNLHHDYTKKLIKSVTKI